MKRLWISLAAVGGLAVAGALLLVGRALGGLVLISLALTAVAAAAYRLL